jgi:putative flippase GtrA
VIERPRSSGAWIGASKFLKFSAVGAIGFLVDASVLQSAVSLFYVSPYAARLASYLAAATVTWWLNRNVTFREASQARAGAQWARFVGLNTIGGAINYGVFAALIATLPLAAHYPVLAVAAGSISGLCCNFLLSKKVAFVSKDQHRIRLQNTH